MDPDLALWLYCAELALIRQVNWGWDCVRSAAIQNSINAWFILKGPIWAKITLYHHHHQYDLLTQGRWSPWIHVAKILIPLSTCYSRNPDPIIQCCKPVPSPSSDSCFLPDKSWFSAIITQPFSIYNILYGLKCSSAHHSNKEWWFTLSFLSALSIGAFLVNKVLHTMHSFVLLWVKWKGQSQKIWNMQSILSPSGWFDINFN